MAALSSFSDFFNATYASFNPLMSFITKDHRTITSLLASNLEAMFGDSNFNVQWHTDPRTMSDIFSLTRYGYQSNSILSDAERNFSGSKTIAERLANSLFQSWSNHPKNPANANSPSKPAPKPAATPSPPAPAPNLFPPRPVFRVGMRVAFAHDPKRLLGKVTKKKDGLLHVTGCEDGELYVRIEADFVRY